MVFQLPLVRDDRQTPRRYVQKDPRWYGMNLKSFNVPVLMKEPVKVTWRTLSRVAGDAAHELPVELDGKIPLDAVSGASER
jgi:hypothetical protein